MIDNIDANRVKVFRFLGLHKVARGTERFCFDFPFFTFTASLDYIRVKFALIIFQQITWTIGNVLQN